VTLSINDTQHKNGAIMLSVVMPERRILFSIMLSVITLSVVVLSVVMLSVVKLSVAFLLLL
jgi:hypothetical protein